MIRDHKAELERLVNALKEEESLHREQIEQCLGSPERKTNKEPADFETLFLCLHGLKSLFSDRIYKLPIKGNKCNGEENVYRS